MQDIEYSVVRSNRKSIALVIDHEANLVVRAPKSVTDDEIDAFVIKKHRWINEKKKLIDVFAEKHPPVVVETGESILFQGNSYVLLKEDRDDVLVEGNEIHIPEDYDQEKLTIWLKGESKKIITERVNFYANTMGVTPGQIKLSEARARWGSCSSKNNLNFAWRLVMCPLSAIDYVVVHELSHITYKNHSPAFWARVKTVLPHYEDDQEWLKDNKKLMDII